RSEALRVPASEVDGMDVLAVRELALAVVERIRGGGGPELVEARTYRFVGHSRSDPGKYRPKGELDRWRERDPLLVAGDRRAASEDELDDVQREVDAELERIEQSALAAPFPEPSDLSEFA